jgi:hypothetical protein
MTSTSPHPPAPSGPKAWWRRFRSFPKPAQIATWAVVGIIGIGAVSGGGEKKDPAPAKSSGEIATTTTTGSQATTSTVPAATSTSAKATTTTAAPATSTTVKATTSTTAKVTTTTTARPTTTTTARATTTTTAKPTTTTTKPASTGTVHPGAFCSPQGAEGYTSAGTHMVCKTTPEDDRARWRSG